MGCQLLNSIYWSVRAYYLSLSLVTNRSDSLPQLPLKCSFRHIYPCLGLLGRYCIGYIQHFSSTSSRCSAPCRVFCHCGCTQHHPAHVVFIVWIRELPWFAYQPPRKHTRPVVLFAQEQHWSNRGRCSWRNWRSSHHRWLDRMVDHKEQTTGRRSDHCAYSWRVRTAAGDAV